MRLAWVAATTFRSYDELTWEPAPGVNLIVGANGAGKTNLLEAVGYLATLGSFRGAPDEALVAYQAESAVVRGKLTGESDALIEIEIRRRGGKRTLVNKQRLARAADLLGYLRMVTFLPEDLDIVKRGPAYRRDFLDAAAVQLWPGSYLDQMEFDRALRQRNAFLKQGEDDEVTLGVWDHRVSQAAGKLMVRRVRAVAALVTKADEAYRTVAGSDGELSMDYLSEWGGSLEPALSASEYADRLVEALDRRRRADRERRVTTAGPHRDEPVLLLDGHELRHHGSQGEQRTAALALRLATHRAVHELIGTAPLLVLDDVFSELDADRSAALASALSVDAQTLVSTADRADVPLDGRVWAVRDGVVA